MDHEDFALNEECKARLFEQRADELEAAQIAARQRACGEDRVLSPMECGRLLVAIEGPGVIKTLRQIAKVYRLAAERHRNRGDDIGEGRINDVKPEVLTHVGDRVLDDGEWRHVIKVEAGAVLFEDGGTMSTFEADALPHILPSEWESREAEFKAPHEQTARPR